MAIRVVLTYRDYTLSGGAFQVAIRMEGSAPVLLPPFRDLALAPSSVWP